MVDIRFVNEILGTDLDLPHLSSDEGTGLYIDDGDNIWFYPRKLHDIPVRPCDEASRVPFDGLYFLEDEEGC